MPNFLTKIVQLSDEHRMILLGIITRFLWTKRIHIMKEFRAATGLELATVKHTTDDAVESLYFHDSHPGEIIFNLMKERDEYKLLADDADAKIDAARASYNRLLDETADRDREFHAMKYVVQDRERDIELLKIENAELRKERDALKKHLQDMESIATLWEKRSMALLDALTERQEEDKG